MTAPVINPKTPDGCNFGQSPTDKIGFYGCATPVVQPAVLTAPASTAATNSTPYGFSQAQADAIVTWIRAMDVIVKANGFTAAS